MKIKTVFLSCLMMRFTSSHASMSSPFIEGTLSNSGISSKDIHSHTENTQYISEFLIGEQTSYRHWSPLIGQIFCPLLILLFWPPSIWVKRLTKLKIHTLLLAIFLFDSCSENTKDMASKSTHDSTKLTTNIYTEDTIPEYGSYKYRMLAIEFTNQVLRTSDPSKIPALHEDANLHLQERIRQIIINDTQTFSKDEIKRLKACMASNVPDWKPSEFKGFKFIRQKQIDSLMAHEDYNIYNKYSIHQISLPIFLRNGSYCIISQVTDCGAWCSIEFVALYEKRDGVWREIKTYERMVS